MPHQIAGITTLVWVACAYALLLVGIGWSFDRMARRSSQRSVASRTFGFTYHESHDAWQCPEDQWLWPTAYDRDNRVMRYRADADICNTCPVKSSCTVSHQGREIVREVDPWPYSASGRFHRGLATVVALFSVVIMGMSAVLFHRPLEIALEITVALVCLMLTIPLGIKLVRTPENYYESPYGGHVRSTSAEESTAVLIDRFEQKWGGVRNERIEKSRQERERELLPVVSVTNGRRPWRGVKEAPLHKTTAQALQEMNLENSRGKDEN